MKSIAENIILLLMSGNALTIQQTDEGFIIAFSDLEKEEDESLIFVPDLVLLSPNTLDEALNSFYEQHQMIQVQGYQA